MPSANLHAFGTKALLLFLSLFYGIHEVGTGGCPSLSLAVMHPGFSLVAQFRVSLNSEQSKVTS